MTDSRLSGPWDSTRLSRGLDTERDIGLVEKGEMHLQESTVGSRDELGVVAKGSEIVENTVEVDARDGL